MKIFTLRKKFKHFLNKYVQKLDVRNRTNTGRKNKYDNFFYIKRILDYLINGVSWYKMQSSLEEYGITVDAIRKKFNKWIEIGVFSKAFSDFVTVYGKRNSDKIKEMFMDAAVIKNVTARENITGFCKKMPNKRSSKATIICDRNKIGLSVVVTGSKEHDSKHIEKCIDKLPEFALLISLRSVHYVHRS